MSTHHNDQKTGEQPNERRAEGTPKADALPAAETGTTPEDQLEQDALDAGQRHPNRSHDKANLDKPAYGGGH